MNLSGIDSSGVADEMVIVVRCGNDDWSVLRLAVVAST